MGAHGASSQRVPLMVQSNTHQPSAATATLLRDVGGPDAIRRMTDLFYEKAIADPNIGVFIRSAEDPHAQRMANWVVEKMGGPPLWSQERATRPQVPVMTSAGLV